MGIDGQEEGEGEPEGEPSGWPGRYPSPRGTRENGLSRDVQGGPDASEGISDLLVGYPRRGGQVHCRP